MSTESQVMHANVRQGTKETDDMVVSKERLKLGVALILIVLTMLNVEVDRVRADQDLKQLEQFVLTSTSVNGKRIFVGLVLLALTK